ncbi:MAG: peptidylprolyl isomerase [Planctomycetota bacterium]
MKQTPSLTLLTALLVVSCGEPKIEQSSSGDNDIQSEKSAAKSNDGGGKVRREPNHITVDHILVGVTHPKLAVKRTITDARALTKEIVQKIEDGADWASLKDQYSDDRGEGSGGGPYGMSNTGVRPDVSRQERKRSGMVPAFGNVGFALKVGEIGVANYDATTSPFGYHIIKRIR